MAHSAQHVSDDGNPCWWEHKDERDLAATVSDVCEFLRQDAQPRKEKYQRLLQQYENKPLASLDAGSKSVEGYDGEEVLPLNLSRSMADAAQSRIAKNVPTAQFVTDGADLASQRRTKRLDLFISGVRYKNRFDELAAEAFLDSTIWADAMVKVFPEVLGDQGHVRIERVYPWEVFVDPVDAHYGKPRSMFQCKPLDKGKLLHMYPKHKKAIRDEPSISPKESGIRSIDPLAKQVWVNEAWHLPSVEGASDGRHVITMGDVVLYDEPWKTPRFPFAILQWSKGRLGFWGSSLLEEVESVQDRLNEVDVKIESAIYHHVTPKFFVPEGSNYDEGTYDNDIRGVVIRYSGPQPPTVQPTVAVSSDLLRERQTLIEFGYNFSGVSQMSAQAKKPSGADSGKALLTLQDNESERFYIKGKAWEQFAAVDVSLLIIDCARRLHDAGYDVEVTAERKRRRRSTMHVIKWSEVHLDRDAFHIKAMSVSGMPHTPAGRFAVIEQLMGSGLITPDEGRMLLEYPDLDAAMSRKLAPYEIVLDQLEMILDEPTPELVLPEPFQNLSLCLEVGQQAYLRAKMDKAEPERLLMLQRYIQTAERLLNPPQPEAPSMPQGAPMPPPTPGMPADVPPEMAGEIPPDMAAQMAA